jgi:hypothetical protein
VFTRVEEAIRHIRDQASQQEGQQQETEQGGGTGKRTALRQILEKQHLVKERTSTNLLAHLKECAARDELESGAKGKAGKGEEKEKEENAIDSTKLLAS